MQRIITVVIVVASIALFGCGTGSGQSGERGGEGDVLPAHERELQALPQFPGSVHYGRDTSTGAGSFAEYSVPASPADVMSFFGQRLPPLGWQLVSSPTLLPVSPKREGQEQTAQTFVRGKFKLTIQANNYPPKGEAVGNIDVLLRLQEQ